MSTANALHDDAGTVVADLDTDTYGNREIALTRAGLAGRPRAN